MNAGLAILSAVLLVLLVLVRLVRPERADMSRFELARRAKLGDDRAVEAQRRERAWPVLIALRRAASVFLLLGLLWALTDLLSIVWAAAIIAVLTLLSGLLESDVPKFIHGLYRRIEPRLLALSEAKVLRLLPARKPRGGYPGLGSTEELVHEIGRAPFLDAGERELVRAALEFPALSVRDAMRPRSALRSIDKGEVLGPLVIDDLYKTGEAVFLVTDGDLDAVVGTLGLEKLTGLELTGSPNALKAMDDGVEFIDDGASMSEALSRLRGTGAPLLVVQDDSGRTVGTVSLEQIIDRLFGT